MTYVTDKQICLNADRSKIVPCDSEEAAMTLALPGVELADEVAAQYGLGVEQKAVTEAPANKALDMPKGKK